MDEIRQLVRDFYDGLEGPIRRCKAVEPGETIWYTGSAPLETDILNTLQFGWNRGYRVVCVVPRAGAGGYKGVRLVYG